LWDWAAALVALVPVVVYLAGIPLHDGAPGTCDAWTGCIASERDQWEWTAQPWAALGVALGTFVATAVRVAPWLRARPVMVRRASIVALCLLVPVTVGFALLALVVWNTDCSDAGWICFGGPSDALALGSPGAGTAMAAALLVAGAVRSEPTRASALSVIAVSIMTAGVLAVVAWFVAAGAMAPLAAALGA
jgi:hypothetical protein